MLTVKQIEAHRFGKGPERLSDGNGLYIRTYKSGRKSFQTRIAASKKLKWVTLGTYPQMSLKEARIQAAIAKSGGAVEKPIAAPDTPVSPKPTTRPTGAEGKPTLKEVAESWFETKKAGLSNGSTFIRIGVRWRHMSFRLSETCQSLKFGAKTSSPLFNRSGGPKTRRHPAR